MTAEVPPRRGERGREKDRPESAYASGAGPVTTEELRSRFRLSRRQEQILLALIVVAGLVLRFHDYTAAPRPSDNVDELAWAWAGLSLWQGQGPTSWSYLPAYPGHLPLVEPDNGRVLPGVHPWLDHPPGFALLIGGFAFLAGERTFADVSDAVIRIPVILLSLVTLALMYWLGRRLLGPLPALIAATMFALAPGAVLGSREVESELLLAPMLLVVLIISHRMSEGEAMPFEAALLLIACGLGPLVKVPGASFGAIAAVVFAVDGRRKLAGLALLASALGLLIFVAYGLLIDWRQFLAVSQAQASRHFGLTSGYAFITAPAGFSDAVSLRDGWWILGWLGVGVAAWQWTRLRNGLLLAWPVVAYAVTMMLLADTRVADHYGWYRFTVYPLVYLLAANLCAITVIRPTLVRAALLLILPGAAATLGLASNGGPWSPPFVAALLIVAGVIGLAGSAGVATTMSILRGESRMARVAELVTGAAVAFILALNLEQSARLADIYTSLS